MFSSIIFLNVQVQQCENKNKKLNFKIYIIVSTKTYSRVYLLKLRFFLLKILSFDC